MLTVITPATATDLTTLERARSLLGFAAAQDATVGILIAQASRAIVDHCQRPFGSETVTETFEAPCRAGGVILGRSPVTEILSVSEGSEIIAPARYQHDAETNALFHIGEDGWRLCWQTQIAATYTAGYVLPAGEDGGTLPASVERACVRLLSAYLSTSGRDALIKSETTEGVGSTSWWVPSADGALADPEAEQLLAPYRRLF